jgi:hypothetical protein
LQFCAISKDGRSPTNAHSPLTAPVVGHIIIRHHLLCNALPVRLIFLIRADITICRQGEGRGRCNVTSSSSSPINLDNESFQLQRYNLRMSSRASLNTLQVFRCIYLFRNLPVPPDFISNIGSFMILSDNHALIEISVTRHRRSDLIYAVVGTGTVHVYLRTFCYVGGTTFLAVGAHLQVPRQSLWPSTMTGSFGDYCVSVVTYWHWLVSAREVLD